MKVERIFDILNRYQEVYPDQTVALGGKVGKEWVTYSPKIILKK